MYTVDTYVDICIRICAFSADVNNVYILVQLFLAALYGKTLNTGT